MDKESGRSQKNIHFRQTPKEFRSAKQAQSYSSIKRNIPYSILTFTRKKIGLAISKVKGGMIRIKMKLPKEAKKIK